MRWAPEGKVDAEERRVQRDLLRRVCLVGWGAAQIVLLNNYQNGSCWRSVRCGGGGKKSRLGVTGVYVRKHDDDGGLSRRRMVKKRRGAARTAFEGSVNR